MEESVIEAVRHYIVLCDTSQLDEDKIQKLLFHDSLRVLTDYSKKISLNLSSETDSELKFIQFSAIISLMTK
jgi:hypothetical protein